MTAATTGPLVAAAPVKELMPVVVALVGEISVVVEAGMVVMMDEVLVVEGTVEFSGMV
jgi:hypothetical protein